MVGNGWIKEILGWIAERMNYLELMLPEGTVFLMFHRIVDEVPFLFDRSLCVSRKGFETLLGYLSEQRFVFVNLNDWLAKPDENNRQCVITFDDGWVDNYYNALPILKKRGVPATIFLSTKLVDSGDMFWFEKIRKLFECSIRTGQGPRVMWDIVNKYTKAPLKARTLDVKSLPKLISVLKECHIKVIDSIIEDGEKWGLSIGNRERNVLSWAEIREMSKNGITFGSHGVNHSILPRLSREEKRNEIDLSKAALENAEIAFCPVFSFPNGIFDCESVDFVKTAGYKAAFSASKENMKGINCSNVFSRICMSENACGSRNRVAYRLFKARLRRESVKIEAQDLGLM